MTLALQFSANMTHWVRYTVHFNTEYIDCCESLIEQCFPLFHAKHLQGGGGEVSYYISDIVKLLL